MRSLNRTISQVAIAQGAAGSTDLVTAQPGCRIYVTAIVVTMSAAGTVKFTEGTGPTDLTGALNVGATGGFVVVSSDDEPVLSTNTKNVKLTITTTVGAATGWIRYYIDA